MKLFGQNGNLFTFAMTNIQNHSKSKDKINKNRAWKKLKITQCHNVVSGLSACNHFLVMLWGHTATREASPGKAEVRGFRTDFLLQLFIVWSTVKFCSANYTAWRKLDSSRLCQGKMIDHCISSWLCKSPFMSEHGDVNTRFVQLWRNISSVTGCRKHDLAFTECFH